MAKRSKASDSARKAALARWRQAREAKAEQRISTEEARRRKEIALAKLRELELAEKEGRLIDKQRVQDAWVKVCNVIRAGVMRIPDRMAQSILAARDPREARQMLAVECEAALRAISEEIRGVGAE